MPVSARNIREQNFSAIEAAREAARQVADVTKQAAESTQGALRTAMDTASQSFQNSAEQVAHSLARSGEQGEELSKQATRNLEAMTECGAILMRGFQETSREWLNLAQHRLQKNLADVQALASCKSIEDVVATQTELARDNIQEIVENSRHLAETSAKVASEAAQTFTGPKKSSSDHQHRGT